MTDTKPDVAEVYAHIDDQKKRFQSVNLSFSQVDALQAEVSCLEGLVYVPGLWRCAKCNFQLVQSNLNANTGAVTARDTPGDKCPNCNSPLWRVTERQAGNDMVDRCCEQMERAKAAEADLAKARAAIQKFGHHTANCAWSVRGAACNCGWLDVSRSARAQSEKL